MEIWETEVKVPPQVIFELTLAEEEQLNLKGVILEQIEAYSNSSAESKAA